MNVHTLSARAKKAGGAVKSKVWGVSAAGLAMLFLASCAGLHYDQDSLRGFPYKILQDRMTDKQWRAQGGDPVVAQLPPNGISARATKDPFYPDFYVFLERTQAPKLFDAVLTSVLSFGGHGLPIDQRILPRINQLLAYSPATGAAMQVALVGTFGKEATRLGIMLNDKFKSRFFEAGDKTYMQLFDATDGSGIHVAVVDEGVLAIQIDNPYETVSNSLKTFETHALRVKALKNKGNSKVLEDYKKPVENTNLDATGVANQAEPIRITDVSEKQAKSFASVLALELATTEPLFGLISFGLKDNDLVSGVRVRILPVGAKSSGVAPAGEVTLNLEFNLLPKSPEKAAAVRTSMKLLLVKLAGMAGIDEAVLSRIQFAENMGHIAIVGLNLTEDQAAKAIPALLKDIPAGLMSPDSQALTQ